MSDLGYLPKFPVISFATAGGVVSTILFLGFSVMAELEDSLPKMAERHDLNVRVASFGGHIMKTVSHLIESVLDWQDSDAVILDLTTPDVRGKTYMPVWLGEMNNIIQAIRSRGRRVGLVHLYRQDVNFEDDEMIRICDQYCAAHGLPSRNLGLEMSSYGEIFTAGVMRDVVHPTRAGEPFTSSI